MKRFYIAATVCLSLTLAACGGGSASATSPQPTGPCEPVTQPTAPPSAPSGIVVTASAVTVAAGQISQGVDINVGAAPSNPPNAQSLGVNTSTCFGGSTAFNTGDTIHRNQTGKVTLFGSGLSHSMTVTVTGPPDIQLVEVCPADLMSTNGIPGMSFRVAVASDAALGARTVLLQNANGVTAFTGGLEVVP